MIGKRPFRIPISVALSIAAVIATASGIAAWRGQAQDAGARASPPARVIWERVPYQRQSFTNVAVATRLDPRASLPRTTVVDVDRTTLPILLPNASTGVERNGIIISSLADVYDVNLPQSTSGLRVLLSGSRVFVPIDSKMMARSKPDMINIGGEEVAAIIQRTEDGWLSSFSRFGMSYTVEVICDQGPALSTCADAAYVRKVTAGMTDVILGAAALADRDQNIEK